MQNIKNIHRVDPEKDVWQTDQDMGRWPELIL